MTKEWKKTILKIAIAVILSVLVLLAGYYLFFYRKDVAFVSKEYTQEKSVLFISSYSESFETLDLQKVGIRRAFADGNIRLDIAYMDMKNFNTERNEELFYQSLRYKLQNSSKYDAILLGDDAALTFAEKYQEDLFPEIPMVFFCINDHEHAVKAGQNPYITGAVEEFYLKETIDNALRFQPTATRIIAIHDNTLTGEGDRKQFFAIKDSYPGYLFEGLNTSEYTQEELGQKLDQLQKDSIVIYMSFFEDAQGNRYTIPESARFLVEHAKTPIYRTSVGGLGDGIIGGEVVSYEGLGYMAGEMVMRILEGESPADIPVVTEGESQVIFDYKVLKKFNIDLSLVPDDAILFNKQLTVYEEYQEIFLPVAMFVFLCLLLVLVMVNDNLKRRRLTRELQSSHEELQETYEKLVAAEEELKQQYEEIEEYAEYLEKKEDYIRHQAEHDYLTGLPNRRAAMETLNILISTKTKGTVVIMDIDDFKEINDSCGHSCGDEVLKEVSARLKSLMDEKLFYACRLGGDEFLLIIKEEEIGPEDPRLLEISRIFHKPVVVDEKEHYIKVSMGVAYFEPEMEEAGQIISNADFAMYTAKRSGKNSCLYYDTDMQDEAVRHKEMKDTLTEACREDNFFVLYQPQVEAGTGAIVGYEALVRLKGKSISPAVFIPVAETTGLILPIGRIVTRKVVSQLASWRERGVPLYPVSINFSTQQIQDKGYVDYLKALLNEFDLPAEYIEIEITESIFINNREKAMKLFEEFRAIGVKLALDDFGTGYSSISYLTYIPVQKIKLDKSLVDIYLKDEKDAFIENLIRLAHGLGLKITVEGVEEANQRKRLAEFNCDYIQGYYFCKPISGEEVERLENPIK